MEKQRSYEADVGNFLIIYILGKMDSYIAEITKVNPLEVKVEETGSYSCLKTGLVQAKETEMFQRDLRKKTHRFLEEVKRNDQEVFCGLTRLGCKDGKLRKVLLPSAE